METKSFGGTPWKAEIKPLTDPNHIVIWNNEGYPIARVQWPDDPGFQQIANLITAAPELSDTVEEFLIIMDAGYGFPDREKLVSLYAKAKKVYAKTDGFYRPRPEKR
ncbi:MAG: hypothetical protein WC593_15140 [Methanoregula sp.]